MFVASLDLGQAADFTALAVDELTEIAHPIIDRKRAWKHDIRFLKRWPLGIPYPQIVSEVGDMVQAKLPSAPLVVDQTGVGRAVVDLFRCGRISTRIVPVTITAGQTASHDADGWKVPKKDLVGALQSALQSRRFTVSPGLVEGPILKKELGNFRVKITAAMHESFAAWREGQHDDLVLAVAMACWWGERRAVGDWSKAFAGDPGMTFPQF